MAIMQLAIWAKRPEYTEFRLRNDRILVNEYRGTTLEAKLETARKDAERQINDWQNNYEFNTQFRITEHESVGNVWSSQPKH
jgi:hypothetical protein